MEKGLQREAIKEEREGGGGGIGRGRMRGKGKGKGKCDKEGKIVK